MSCGDTMNPGQFSWFAFHVRARFEKTVAINLSRRGFDAFLPTCKPRGGLFEQRHGEMPLFPKYVFCRVQAAELRSLLMIPGVMQIAGTAAGVKPVDEGEIAAVKQVVQAARYYQPCPFRKTGQKQKVRVAGGELHNLEGILAESRHGNAIIVGIALLQRGVLVEIGDAARVVPVSNTSTGAVDFLTGLKEYNLWNWLEQDGQAVGMPPHRSGELDQTIRFIPATVVPATVVFDSSRQTSLAGARGIPDPTTSLVLQTDEFDIHLQICREQQHRQILGQILPRGSKHFAKARCYLLRNGEKLQVTAADTLGEFNFSEVPEGALNLQVELPSLTITGALNC